MQQQKRVIEEEIIENQTVKKSIFEHIRFRNLNNHGIERTYDDKRIFSYFFKIIKYILLRFLIFYIFKEEKKFFLGIIICNWVYLFNFN